MTHSNSVKERRKAVDELHYNFVVLPDKERAWSDLIGLTQDENEHVRWKAVESLGVVFPYFLEKHKERAWSDLIGLTQDEDRFVRAFANHSLGVALIFKATEAENEEDFKEELEKALEYFESSSKEMILNNPATFCYYFYRSFYTIIFGKQEAKEEVKNNYLIKRTFVDIEYLFSWNDIPGNDKERLIEFLKKRFSIDWVETAKIEKIDDGRTIRLSTGKNSLSLKLNYEKTKVNLKIDHGRTDEFIARTENGKLNIYDTTKQEAKEEVNKYLEVAKIVGEGSEIKEKLLEAIENLFKALKEAQMAKDFNGMKCDLKKIKMYCDHAEKLLDTTNGKALGAGGVLRRGIPFIRKKISQLLYEVQDKARLACQQSKGTPTEEIACAANKEIQKWHIDNQDQMTCAVENLIFSLSIKIPNIPENKRIFDKIEEIRNEGNIIEQYKSLTILIAMIPTAIIYEGGVINVSGVTTSDNSQTIIKGNENKINPKKSSTFGHEPTKRWIDILNSSATVAALVGFIAVETGTYIYALSYNHIISVIIALIVFVIVALLNRN